MPTPLRIELDGQRLEPRPQVYRVRRCVDCSACTRKKRYDESRRKPVYTVPTHP